MVGMDDYQQVVASFHSESDRGAALLAASIVETYLGQYLRQFMKVEDNEVSKHLFEGVGPLSSLSSRHEVAYAFGWINVMQRSDLRYIREIRNFAHHPWRALTRVPL